MLYTRHTHKGSRIAGVKTARNTLAAFLAIGTLAAANASYASSALVDRVVTVKIKMSDFEAPNGTALVYEKLQTKAKRECSADKSTLSFFGQSVAECTQDLLVQFIESAEIDSLLAYHESQS